MIPAILRHDLIPTIRASQEKFPPVHFPFPLNIFIFARNNNYDHYGEKIHPLIAD